VSGTDYKNKGEFTFSFWASLYADDAATPLASREALLAATNAMYDHLRLFGLLMHVGTNGKRSKTEAMFCPARSGTYSAGDTSDLLLDCGGTVSFTESFVYLGSLLHYDLSDHHDGEARLKKAPQAFGALRSKIFSSRDMVVFKLENSLWNFLKSHVATSTTLFIFNLGFPAARGILFPPRVTVMTVCMLRRAVL
jgi:hypothetical protein